MNVFQKLIMGILMVLSLSIMVFCMPFVFIKTLLTSRKIDDVDYPIPAEWLKESISHDELEDIYKEKYKVGFGHCKDIDYLNPTDGITWNKIIELLPTADEIRRFDSGFCNGIALVKGSKIIAHITLMHYSRL